MFINPPPPRATEPGPGYRVPLAFLSLALLVAAVTVGAPPVSASSEKRSERIRFATFNAALNRNEAGVLVENLSAPYDGSDPTTSLPNRQRWQAANVAEVLQRTRPDVVLLNEFDWDGAGEAVDGFQTNYLSVSQNGADPIDYPHVFLAPSNTGVGSGVDLDNSGAVGGPGDAFGFGLFPGQYAMVVLSRYPIRTNKVRTFQNFLWADMPANLIPIGFYSPEAVEVLRLSSKSHWDVPIDVGGTTIHFLVSHPTPPVFDGPEDRNGRRNHDEIRFWADYVQPQRSRYIYDDDGRRGGLGRGARFVIAGDLNADRSDGDSYPGAVSQLLDLDLISDAGPSSTGGPEAALRQGGANVDHLGSPALDTADFADGSPGNLRVDYVLPSRNLHVADAAVFWPSSTDPLSRLTGTFDNDQFQQDGIGFPTSDHRLVWVDLTRHRPKRR